MKVNIVFYSMYGHMFEMVKAAAEGAREVPGTQANLYRVKETLSDEVLTMMGALEAKRQFEDIPEATLDVLEEADGLMFGIPTRFGNMSEQMKRFIDMTGVLWAKGSLIGKPAGIMSSSATQHGGQESTILTSMIPLLHHGMIYVGLDNNFSELARIDEASGSSFYGASTIVGGSGERMPSRNELDAAAYQGKKVAQIAAKLSS